MGNAADDELNKIKRKVNKENIDKDLSGEIIEEEVRDNNCREINQ